MKKNVLIVCLTIIFIATVSTSCGNDNMSVKSKNDVEFFIMRINEDYIEIPGACNCVYLGDGGTYPELENGQIAKVIADIDIYEGGEAGYTGNYFIKELKSFAIMQYDDVVNNIDVPEATENKDFQYGEHMLQYKDNNMLYFLVLNRQYVDVYLNDKKFMEYEFQNLDNDLAPFFYKVK